MSTYKLAAGNPGIKYTDTATLTFNYTGGNWVFSLTNISPEVQRLIDQGYAVTLHYIAYVPGKSKTDLTREAKNSGEEFLNTYWKPNLHLNITTEVQTNPTSFNITSWFSQALTIPVTFKECRSKAFELLYTDEGYWFRRFKLGIEIQNVIRIVTPEITTYLHCPAGNGSSVDFALTEVVGNTITLYE